MLLAVKSDNPNPVLTGDLIQRYIGSLLTSECFWPVGSRRRPWYSKE